MPRVGTRKRSFLVTSFSPLGLDGVDLFTDAAQLPPTALAGLTNGRLSKDVVERRNGGAKLTSFTSPLHSLTFGTVAKYATFTMPLIPKGGFALLMSFTAVWSATATAARILGSMPTGQAWHVLTVSIDNAGLISVTWRDSGGSTRTVTTTSVTNGAATNLLAIYDAVAGTFTAYVNGASSGTPLTSLSATLQPDQTSGVVSTFGVEKVTGGAVTADSDFDGKVDQFVLFALRGTRPAAGTTTLASVLVKHSSHRWPTPGMDAVLQAFDMTRTSGTTLYDVSYGGNNATLVAGPTVTDPVAYAAIIGNVVVSIQSPSAQRWNLFAAGGSSYYERAA